jgi:alpha-D-ribose 1-methylphosphonate 5-triphosphate synthase subunit PhnH
MSALAPAFADAARDSQSVFRAVMDAMARPGTERRLLPALQPPQPLSRGAGAVALTLLDYETPVWLDAPLAASADVTQWLRFHTGAPVTTDPGRAVFGLIAGSATAPDFAAFALGSAEYPDRSTTLVLQVDRFSGPSRLRLCGPGLAADSALSFKPCPVDFADRLQRNHALFPRGIDLLLVTDDAVVALPRSTRVERGS